MLDFVFVTLIFQSFQFLLIFVRLLLNFNCLVNYRLNIEGHWASNIYHQFRTINTSEVRTSVKFQCEISVFKFHHRQTNLHSHSRFRSFSSRKTGRVVTYLPTLIHLSPVATLSKIPYDLVASPRPNSAISLPLLVRYFSRGQQTPAVAAEKTHSRDSFPTCSRDEECIIVEGVGRRIDDSRCIEQPINLYTLADTERFKSTSADC